MNHESCEGEIVLSNKSSVIERSIEFDYRLFGNRTFDYVRLAKFYCEFDYVRLSSAIVRLVFDWVRLPTGTVRLDTPGLFALNFFVVIDGSACGLINYHLISSL